MDTEKNHNRNDMKSIAATSIAFVLLGVLTWRYLPEATENILTTLSQAILEIYLGICFIKSVLKIVVNGPRQDGAEENIMPQSAEGYMKLLVLMSVGILDAINTSIHGVGNMVNTAIADGTYSMNPFADLYFRMFFIHMLVFSIDSLPDIVEMIMSRKKKSVRH